jgi:ABC-type transporter Mla subunit MlaD
MQLQRNELMTGLLVVGTIAVLTGILILLGAPGLFRPLVTYKIYLDNAAGIKLGAPVLLAGRKIGQVEKLYSPVSREESKRAEDAANAIRPADPLASPAPADNKPKFEVRIDVQVDKNAFVYKDAQARLITLGLLGETAIDITQGNESSGRANDGELFAGERVPGFGEAMSKMLEVIKPVATEATATMKELENTSQNLSRITDENSQLNMAIAQFRTFAENITNMTARDSSLNLSLKNIEQISDQLTRNENIEITLQNFRESSDHLKATMNDLGPVGKNIREFTETVKTQPWRLIYPTTKKYPETSPSPAGETITVRKSTKAQRSSPTPTPTTRKRGDTIIP